MFARWVCALRGHPERYMDHWVVKPCKSGPAFFQSGPSNFIHDGPPFAAIAWQCPTCGHHWLVQVTS